MKKIVFVIVALSICAALAVSFRKASKAESLTIEKPSVSYKQQTFNKLTASARQTGSARVIVGLRSGFTPEGDLNRAELSRQRLGTKREQEAFLSRYQSFRISEIKQFQYIPFVAMEADAATLEQMQNDSSILSIQEDEIAEPALAESTQIVGAPAAWSGGYTGSGQTIAIIDSGIDKTHSFLNGKVISEACYSSNNAAGTVTSFCPDGVTESTGSGSGINCPASINGCAHGTNVAGIAAGRGNSFSGVAKDANIIAIQIFSKFNTSDCNPAPCGRYFTSDLIRGLERVKTLSNTINNIAAVNVSMQTGQQFASNCDVAHAATKAAIDNLRSVGIATIICAGNHSFTNALTAPACISTAISVGSTDDGSSGTNLNSVSNFSNSSPLLHLLAPGRWISSSIPGNVYQNYSGTSMAAPHVAGAFAILKQRKPNATITQMLNALILTGQPILDARNNITKPRINVAQAVNRIAARKGTLDFDGDGKADVSVFRPSAGSWYLNRSTAGFTGMQFGLPNDKLAPADYDGDGKTDIAVFRDGNWYISQSSNNAFRAVQFGSPGDVPVPADYDGDDKADVAVFRQGVWYFLNSSNNQFRGVQFGISTDKPVAADFDGDGKTDVAVFRDGFWYWLESATNQFRAVQFGIAADIPVVSDYDGDSKADQAVFRNGEWYLNRSTAGFTGIQFGISSDTPTPEDYDGDGKAEVSVFRDGNWYRLNSANSQFFAIQFGNGEDKPVPAAFIP